MFVPILLVGAAAFGVWYVMKGKNETKSGPAPSVPEPPSEDSLITVSASMPAYVVQTEIFQVDSETYINRAGFTTWQSAWEYYKQVVAFFDDNHGHWTCPQGSGNVSVYLFDASNTIKTHKLYSQCANTYVPMNLRNYTDELRSLLKSIGIGSSVPDLPTVSMSMITPDKREFAGRFQFKYHNEALDYYNHLVDSFKNKDAVEFYRPDGGLLRVSFLFDKSMVGSGNIIGDVYQWDGTEIPNQLNEVRPQHGTWETL